MTFAGVIIVGMFSSALIFVKLAVWRGWLKFNSHESPEHGADCQGCKDAKLSMLEAKIEAS